MGIGGPSPPSDWVTMGAIVVIVWILGAGIAIAASWQWGL